MKPMTAQAHNAPHVGHYGFVPKKVARAHRPAPTMTSRQRKRYKARYLASVGGRNCDCGRRAAGVDGSGFFCAECKRLNDAFYGKSQVAWQILTAEADKVRRRPMMTQVEKYWDGFFGGFAKGNAAGWGSLELLERQLAA